MKTKRAIITSITLVCFLVNIFLGTISANAAGENLVAFNSSVINNFFSVAIRGMEGDLRTAISSASNNDVYLVSIDNVSANINSTSSNISVGVTVKVKGYSVSGYINLFPETDPKFEKLGFTICGIAIKSNDFLTGWIVNPFLGVLSAAVSVSLIYVTYWSDGTRTSSYPLPNTSISLTDKNFPAVFSYNMNKYIQNNPNSTSFNLLDQRNISVVNIPGVVSKTFSFKSTVSLKSFNVNTVNLSTDGSVKFSAVAALKLTIIDGTKEYSKEVGTAGLGLTLRFYHNTTNNSLWAGIVSLDSVMLNGVALETLKLSDFNLNTITVFGATVNVSSIPVGSYILTALNDSLKSNFNPIQIYPIKGTIPSNVYIADLTVSAGSTPNVNIPSGYTKLDQDINYCRGGDYLYILQKFNPAGLNLAGVTDIKTIILDRELRTSDVPVGYTPIGYDLNTRMGGKYVYFCYSKAAKYGAYINALKIIYSPKADIPAPMGYEKVAGDLKSGCGGDYEYLCFQRQ